MSGSKREWERLQNERRRAVGSRFVCADCFDDYAIKEFVSSIVSECECSYCGSQSDENIAAEIDEVISFIARGINREYEDPANEVPYDSSEGGYLIEPIDSYDLITDLGIIGDGPGFSSLHDDITGAFCGEAYVHHDPMGSTESEILRYTWKGFCNTVKHETRFVFYRIAPEKEDASEYSNPEEGIPVHAILDNLSRLVLQHELTTILPRGRIIVRARQHPIAESFAKACDLGSPPENKASQSRMSPAGIPMFYGALNAETALVEILDTSKSTDNAITYGYFAATRDLCLIDLERAPAIPSLFDEDKCDLRHSLIFWRDFVKDISAPIAHDGCEHYEYVPTQIVSEYFRKIFRMKDGSRVDGIKFRSSKAGASTCYCLFADKNNCVDPNWESVASGLDKWRIKPIVELVRVKKEPLP